MNRRAGRVGHIDHFPGVLRPVVTPPLHRLCVFSRHTSVVAGTWMLEASRTAPATDSAEIRPLAWSLGTSRTWAPDNGRRPPRLVPEHVGFLAHDHLVAATAPGQGSDQVAHRPAGGQLKSGLLAQHLGGAFLHHPALIEGSSPNTSSPTSASAIARRISSVGWVMVGRCAGR